MTGEKVGLRALEPADLDFLFALENDQSIWHLSNTLSPFSRFVLEQYLMNSLEDIYTTKQLRLVIESMDGHASNATIGLIDLYEFDPHNSRAGVGIVIKKEARNNSYATEALELFTEYCFTTLRLQQIFAGIPENNTASRRLFEKCGFVKTGVRKHWLCINDEWIDEIFYQRFRFAEHDKKK